MGWCFVKTENPTELVSYGQSTPYDFVTWAVDLLYAVDEVACEKFRISQRTLKSLGQGVQDCIDVEGWVHLECLRRGKKFTTQNNGDALMFSDDRLRELGWWNLGQARSNRDVRSACRHMLKYLVDHGYLPY